MSEIERVSFNIVTIISYGQYCDYCHNMVNIGSLITQLQYKAYTTT